MGSSIDRSEGRRFDFQQERRNIFLPDQLSVLTFTQCPFHPRHTTVARKRPRLFCEKSGGQATPTHRGGSGLTMLSMRVMGTYKENELTQTSSENTCPQLSQPAEPLWTDHAARELICTIYKKKRKKEKEKRRRGVTRRTSTQIVASEEKAIATPPALRRCYRGKMLQKLQQSIPFAIILLKSEQKIFFFLAP